MGLKYFKLLHNVDVLIDVYMHLPTVADDGTVESITMCRNQYFLKYNGTLGDASPLPATLGNNWWFTAVNEAGSELNIFLHAVTGSANTEDDGIYLCAESTAAVMMEIHSLIPGRQAAVQTMQDADYSDLHVTRDTTSQRPVRGM